MKPTEEQIAGLIKEWVSTIKWDDNPSEEEVNELAKDIWELDNEAN